MFEEMFNINFAIVAVAVVIALFIWFKTTESAASTKRMSSMMARVGLASRIAARRDARTTAVVKEARRRCGRCPREDVCERWLAGRLDGANEFCPNARVFDALAKTGAA